MRPRVPQPRHLLGELIGPPRVTRDPGPRSDRRCRGRPAWLGLHRRGLGWAPAATPVPDSETPGRQPTAGRASRSGRKIPKSLRTRRSDSAPPRLASDETGQRGPLKVQPERSDAQQPWVMRRAVQRWRRRTPFPALCSRYSTSTRRSGQGAAGVRCRVGIRQPRGSPSQNTCIILHNIHYAK